jgi:hypothetical protein
MLKKAIGISLLILFCLSLLLTASVQVWAQNRQPGVKTGDWIKYSWTTTNDKGIASTVYATWHITAVNGPKVAITIVDENSTSYAELDLTKTGDERMFMIWGNNQPGDTVNFGGSGELPQLQGPTTLFGRETHYITYYEGENYYEIAWDKATGALLEFRSVDEGYNLKIMLEETNMWDTNAETDFPYALAAAIIVVVVITASLVGVVLKKRSKIRYSPQTDLPPAPPPPSDYVKPITPRNVKRLFNLGAAGLIIGGIAAVILGGISTLYTLGGYFGLATPFPALVFPPTLFIFPMFVFVFAISIAGRGYRGIKNAYRHVFGTIGYVLAVLSAVLLTVYFLSFPIYFAVALVSRIYFDYYFFMGLNVLSFVVFGATQIVWGITHIITRTLTGKPKLSMSAGIMFIVSGVACVSVFFAPIGLILYLISAILGAMVFASAKIVH